MKSKENKSKGITLITLSITIIVLSILASVTTYSGVEVIRHSKFVALETELNIMQTEVNRLYEKWKNNEKVNGVDVLQLGIPVSEASQASKAFSGANISDTLNYRYYDKDTIKSLNLDEIKGTFLVNVQDRMVISYEGVNYEGQMYYSLEQFPNGLYNVSYDAPGVKPGETAIGGNKLYSVTSSKYGTAIIPEGFTVSKIPGETTIENGLVIYDIPEDVAKTLDWEMDATTIQESYNQFVWVPVTNYSQFQRIAGYYDYALQSIDYYGEMDANGDNVDSFSVTVTENEAVVEETKSMYKSIEANKGFYIGRYEAGIEGNEARTSVSGISSDVVIKKNKYTYNYIGWSDGIASSIITGGAVAKSRNYNATNNPNGFKFANSNIKATSTLCYAVQWDTTLSFINDTEYNQNSTGKGWYYDNYYRNPNQKTGIDVDSNKSNSPKNIYDMAGNVCEWTMESYFCNYTTNRVIRRWIL